MQLASASLQQHADPGCAASGGSGWLPRGVRLLPIEARHAPQLMNIASDPLVGPRAGISLPLRPDWAKSFCTWRALPTALCDAITFVVVTAPDLSTQRVLGCAGLHDLDVVAETAELSIWLAADRWGRGIGSATTRTLLDFGFRSLGLARVHARCLPDNERAWRLLRRMGFSPDSTWLGAEGHALRDAACGLSLPRTRYEALRDDSPGTILL